MKKNYMKVLDSFGLGFVAAIIILTLMSYKTTEGVHPGEIIMSKAILPLQQKNIVVTENYEYVKKLLAKGYVCEDVDFVQEWAKSGTRKFYTLIKY